MASSKRNIKINLEPDKIDVGYAGLKVQTLLNDIMAQLLSSQQD